VSALLADRAESAVFAAVWAHLGPAHAFCGGWSMDLDGTVTCRCSAVSEPFAADREAGNHTLIPAGGAA
jgi:hypothetical protein